MLTVFSIFILGLGGASHISSLSTWCIHVAVRDEETGNLLTGSEVPNMSFFTLFYSCSISMIAALCPAHNFLVLVHSCCFHCIKFR